MPAVVPSQIVDLIDAAFPFAKEDRELHINDPHLGTVSAIVRLVDEIPNELITISGAEYNQFVSAVEAIRSTEQMWRSHGRIEMHAGVRLGSNVRALRICLTRLPDQAIPPSVGALAFITDAALRESIRADMAAADQALHNGGWKAATVLAGAAIEALLLWAISRKSAADRQTAIAALAQKPKGNDPNGWTLQNYVDLAEHFGMIGGNTVTQVRLAQAYRNFIHPGKAQRTGEQCDRNTAMTGIAALGRVVNSLP
jgi:hypothetical protein